MQKISRKFLFSSFDKILIRKNKCIDLLKARVILSLRIWQLYLYFKLEPRKQGILFQIFVWVLESPYGATSIIQKDSINAENAWKKILSWGGSICQTHMIACLMNLRNLCLGSVPFTRYKSCIFLLEEFLHSFYVTLPCLCKQDKRVNFFMYFSYILLDLWMMGVCSITQKKQVLFLKSAFDFMEEFILGVKLWCAQNRYNAVKIDLNYPASNLEFCCVWLWWTKFNWKGKQNTGSDFSEWTEILSGVTETLMSWFLWQNCYARYGKKGFTQALCLASVFIFKIEFLWPKVMEQEYQEYLGT